jgi:hypothetical protein
MFVPTLGHEAVVVARGQVLEEGSLWPRSPGARIVLALFDGGTKTLRSAKRITRSWEAEKGGFDRLAAAAGRFFLHPGDRYVPTLSRTGVGRTWQDAVVALNPPCVDLGPVFPEERRYLVLVQRRGLGSGEEGEWIGEKKLEVQVQAGKASAVPASVFEPGLYRLVELDRLASDHEPTGRDAWVLVVAPERFPAALASFRRAAGITISWTEKLGEAEARGRLRAFLEVLSEPDPPDANGSGQTQR